MRDVVMRTRAKLGTQPDAVDPRLFVPVRTSPPSASPPSPDDFQHMYPTVDENGIPHWQVGDVGYLHGVGDMGIRVWDLDALGWCHGAIANSRYTTHLRGTVYLTASRVVVVSDHSSDGRNERPYGFSGEILRAAVRTKMSKVRAQRPAAGSFLVAQMRLPWLSRVIFGPPSAPWPLRGTVRLCGQQLADGGGRESVQLLMHLRQAGQTVDFVSALAERVVADRREWVGSARPVRDALHALPAPANVLGAPGELPLLCFAGGYLISAATAGYGTNSGLLRPV